MDLTEIVYMDRRWMELTQDHVRRQALELVVLNLQVQYQQSCQMVVIIPVIHTNYQVIQTNI
jgi:hypothetical protein